MFGALGQGLWNCVFGIGGRGAGSEQASDPQEGGRRAGLNEMEEGAPGQPFLSPPGASLAQGSPRRARAGVH